MSLIRIAKVVADKHDLPAEVVRVMLLDAVREIEQQAMVNGRCAIRGFGVFKRQRFAAKPARNPRTGEAVLVPERTRLVFQQGADRAEALETPEG